MKLSILPLACAALALSACGGGQKSRPATLAAAPERGTVDRAAMLLDAGNVAAARKELKAILKASPNDPNALLLRDSLDRDPVELLGPNSFTHVVQPGETMMALSSRFLGNRLKSYQLARYNKIAVPADLAAGTTLRIPGEAPRPTAPVVRSEPKPKPKPAAARANAKAERPAKPAPTATAANPAAAARARAVGLASLNQGRVAQAVVALRRARALDPGNPLIQRDLARAERITAAVRAKR